MFYLLHIALLTKPEYWSEILRHFNQNGVTIFMSGFLFTLAAYHFLLYFQHKDKSYLYYSLYTFLIFIYLFYKAEHFFLADIFSPYKAYFMFYSSALQWVFNTIYLLFVKTYIELKDNQPGWNRFLNKSIAGYGIILSVLLVQASISGHNDLLNTAYAYFYVPSISVIAVITLFFVYNVPSFIKYYMLIGSISYMVLSIISYYSSMHFYGSTYLYYIAVLIESSFFALGLGAKQRKIMNDKNRAQAVIIAEQERSIRMQNEAKAKLDLELQKKKEEIEEITRQHQKEQKDKIKENYRKETLDLRMKAFQTQMNPKFLFNSLNALKFYIIHNDRKEASLYLSRLSKLLRKILDNSQLPEVSLHEELKTMKLYMEIENMRVEKRILFDIDVAEDVDTQSLKIPPLVLQPFIENALWHGLSLIEEDRQIHLKVYLEAGYWVISIEDNGIGRIKAAQLNDITFIEKESLGIDITLQRLMAFSKDTQKKPMILFEDLYEDNMPAGTRVYIRIPR